MLRRSRQQHSRGFGFHFRISRLTRHCPGKVLQLIGSCTCTRPHICPGYRFGVLKKYATSRGARWPRQAITFAWRLLLEAKRFPPRAPSEHICSSSSSSSPQNRHSGDSALWQSNSLFCVQTQPQRSSRTSFRCLGGILVLFTTLVVARLSMPAVGLDASHVVTSVSRFFRFGKPQSLPDLVEPPAFGTVQQSQVVTPLSREERRSLPSANPSPAARSVL